MPRRLRLLVGFLAVGLLAVTAGCTLPAVAPGKPGVDSTAPTVAAGAGQATWTPCPDIPKALVGRAAINMSYDCATVAVPQDWKNQDNGSKFNIHLIRVRSKSQKNRIGSLLINPGGPGGSGVDLAVYLSFGPTLGGLPTEITDKFDIVGFDPRGVGRSDPIRCIPAADQDASFGAQPDPVSQAAYDSYVALNQKIADECDAKYGPQLPLYSTEQAAHDMDALRVAVGDQKLTYLGFSYGTLLGATYAQLFPKNIRAMVLDGAVDAKQSYIAGSESQAMGFERAFTNFAAWCKQTPGSCPIAPDARAAVTSAMAAGDTNPVPYKDGRKATSGWVFLSVISSLYTQSSWTRLAEAIAGLKEGDATGVFELADEYAERKAGGMYSNLFDANLAVNCADTTGAPSAAEVRTLQGQWRAKYPLFGGSLAVGMLSCSVWKGARDPYPAAAAVGAPPIVVVGTKGDPATPYENTADLASMLGVGHVLTSDGEGHTAYPSTACIVKNVDGYLLDLTVPPEGTECPAK